MYLIITCCKLLELCLCVRKSCQICFIVYLRLAVTGTTFSLALLAVAFQLAAITSPHTAFVESAPNQTDAHNCQSYV